MVAQGDHQMTPGLGWVRHLGSLTAKVCPHCAACGGGRAAPGCVLLARRPARSACHRSCGDSHQGPELGAPSTRTKLQAPLFSQPEQGPDSLGI